VAAVDEDLVRLALSGLELDDLGEIATGGQKNVRMVNRHGEQLVLKVIALGASAPAALQRAEREVSLLATLNSPHVVRVASDLVELDDPVRGAAWLEELLDGTDLTPLLFNRQWTWGETAELGLQVASGLGAGHARGVVHRDLSANNVRRMTNNTYKVMDFGFARHTLLSGLTVAGQPGTPGYLSPEHLNAYSGGPTPASDVFAVGILMYAALTGELPIPHHGDDADYVRRLLTTKIASLRGLRPDLELEQADLVDRCLHRQPARRYRDGIKLTTALENIA
jgi:serine/threonine protein kinase